MSGRTVLVIAQTQDGTADLVADALLARDAEVARIDLADFPGALSLAATPDRIGSPGWLCVRGRRIDLELVSSVYRRSPAHFSFPDEMSAPERRFATLESVYGLGGVFAAQPWRWIDHPGAVADASYKPRQLRVASQCGLTVPRSLVTNVAARAREFTAEVGGPLVYKTLSTGVVAEADETRIIYTSLLLADDLNDGSIALCCHLFQEWIPKAFDVRLTVVGDRCFAAAVHTTNPEAKIDWRCRYDELRYEVCDAPAEVCSGVRAYLREFDLTFGAFDFSVTPDDRWWFLEFTDRGYACTWRSSWRVTRASRDRLPARFGTFVLFWCRDGVCGADGAGGGSEGSGDQPGRGLAVVDGAVARGCRARAGGPVPAAA